MKSDKETQSATNKKYVRSVIAAFKLDKKVAWAEAKVGDVIIRGIQVWKSGNGRLRVFLPSYHSGFGWEDTVSVPDAIREEIEAEVIATYREHERNEEKKAAMKEAKP